MTRFAIFMLLALVSLRVKGQIELLQDGQDWSMKVDGSSYDIKGVTFGYDKSPLLFGYHFRNLKSMGVNTIRTWGTDENTLLLLDSANKYGIKVMLGIWMRHGRPGMEADDSFDYLADEKGKEEMYNSALQTVERFKDHPALLTWGVGNEVYLNTATDEEKEAYSLLLEQICNRIKQIDPYHPISSVEAWTFGVEWWEKYVPSIDIYGINCYGPGANVIPEELSKLGANKPYLITEFGVTGEWDLPKDQNGVIIEPSDQEKFDAITTGYKNWILPKSNCLGVFIFHYADGDQHLAPWLLSHYKGMYRPQYWAIRQAFIQQTPVNNVPVIEHFSLPEGDFNSKAWIPVSLNISDAEGEELVVDFSYNQRTGSRKRRDQINPLNFRGSLKEGFEVEVPDEYGGIKVYVNVRDTYNNVGIATTSIMVKNEEAKSRKFLVPKATLPFSVYSDGSDTPYVPSGYMGNYQAMEVDLNNTSVVYSGKTSIEISYNDTKGWYGLGFVDPPNDWGDQLGGYDLSGAKKMSFWAKSDKDNIKVKIGLGLINDDKPFPDTAKEHKEITLTREWKQYQINTKKLDLSCIRSGLVIFSSANGFSHKIYLDEVIYE